MIANRKTIRRALLLGATLSALGVAPAPIQAQSNASESETAPVEEQQQYALRLMIQVYDGSRDVSHTQVLGIGRVRQGDRSFTQFDFGDGAVVMSGNQGDIAASRFLNVSDIEKAVIYDYRTQMMYGDDDIAEFHNAVVRPLLGQAPDLGSNASWNSAISLRDLGLLNGGEGKVRMELSREYFEHEGMEMVLVRYAIPAFSYTDSSGRNIVHWGTGISLTDPGFGMIYLNSALHRSVASSGAQTVPYRYAKTMVAANPDGSAMIDYRDVPQLSPYLDELFSADAMRVVPTGAESNNSRPVNIARNLDIIALSIAEDGGNEAPMATGAQTADDRGAEISSGQSADDRAQTLQDLMDTTRPSTTEGGNPASTAGGQGEGQENPYFDNYGVTGEDGSIAQSQYWLDKASAVIGGPIQGFSNMTTDQQADTVGTLAKNLSRQSMATANQVNDLTDFIQRTEEALRTSGEAVLVMTQEAQQMEAGIQASASRLGQAEGTYEALLFEQVQFSSSGETPPPYLTAFLDNAEAELEAARRGMQQSENALEVAVENGRYILEFDQTDPSTARMIDQLGDAYRRLGETNETLHGLQQQAEGLGALMNSLPVQRAADFVQRLGDSPAGIVLDRVSHLMNGYTTAKAGYNVYHASTTDLSSGDLNLTRSHSGGELLLDILALGGSAVSGNAAGFYSDAVAITTGSISDIYVANKAWNDTIIDNQVRREELLGNMKRLTSMIQTQERAKYEELLTTEYGLYTSDPTTDGGVSDPNWQDPRIDPDSGLPTLGYWAYLKANNPGTLESYGIDPTAPVGHTGPWPPVDGGTDDSLTRDEMIAGLEAQINKADYPTARPRDPNRTRDRDEIEFPPPTILTDAQLAVIEREQRREQAQRELDEYQAQKLAEQGDDEPLFPGSYEFRTSTLEISELVVSAFDLKPVQMEEVTWERPTFDEDGDLFVRNPDGTTSLRKVGPDDFELTPFDPPEISKFAPTDPDDLDGYPGTGQYPAFSFDGISGTVATELGPWAEWLSTQDVAALERLARKAGYPNLASALTDADNLINNAMDNGWRAWAMAAPSCTGSNGCGPQFLERWHEKRSRLALGDLLEMDRAFFSSSGLTDVQIAGLMLAFVIADFGLEDGDIVNVTVQQFGQNLLNQTLSTTNAGTSFSVDVQRGVVAVQMTALNTGEIPPNTAELTIQGVTGGETDQQYSLGEGETADLRVTIPGN